MLQSEINLHVRGGRPTRADLFSVRNFSPALRQVTGRGAEPGLVRERKNVCMTKSACRIGAIMTTGAGLTTKFSISSL